MNRYRRRIYIALTLLLMVNLSSIYWNSGYNPYFTMMVRNLHTIIFWGSHFVILYSAIKIRHKIIYILPFYWIIEFIRIY